MSDNRGILYPPDFIRREADVDVPGNFKKITFPGGFSCYTSQTGAGEAELIYNEVMVRQEYFNNGLSITGARCILDVGANIGIFTMAVKLQVPDAAVYAFEPMRKTFEVLEQNVRSLGCSDVHLFNVAIGSEDHTERQFTFFPNMPGNSTTVPSLKDINKPVMDQIFGKVFSDVLHQSETQIAQIRTLSSMIREQGITSIDYLKIDVEGGELSVLEGIEEDHWPILKQVAVEAHTTALREQVHETLVHRGFEVFTDLGLSSPVGVSMVYARML